MFYHIVAVRVVGRFRIWLRFEDGLEGEADLSDLVGWGVFKRWADHPSEFAQVEIDPECATVVWPGGLDVAPDGLYDRIAQAAGRPSVFPE
jgi:hypothetical protein